MKAAATTSDTKAQAALVGEMGQAFSDTATALSALPAPGFTGGADFAARQIAGFKEIGSAAAAAAQSGSAGDLSKYREAEVNIYKGPAATAMGATKLPANIDAELKSVPACAALKS